MACGYNTATYKELLAETLPSVIETEEENEKALEFINRLMDKGEENLSPDERKLFKLYVCLIEAFERERYPMGSIATPIDALKSLMEEHELKQKDVLDIFGSQGIASEILSGKREISKAHAKKLSERFHVPADLFI